GDRRLGEKRTFRRMVAPQPFAPAQDQTGPPAGTGLCQLVGHDHKLPSGDPAPDPVITQSAAVHPTEPSGDIPGCLGACADRNRAGARRGSRRVPVGPRYVAARVNCFLLGADDRTWTSVAGTVGALPQRFYCNLRIARPPTSAVGADASETLGCLARRPNPVVSTKFLRCRIRSEE